MNVNTLNVSVFLLQLAEYLSRNPSMLTAEHVIQEVLQHFHLCSLFFAGSCVCPSLYPTLPLPQVNTVASKSTLSSSESFRTTWCSSTSHAACWSSSAGSVSGWIRMQCQQELLWE